MPGFSIRRQNQQRILSWQVRIAIGREQAAIAGLDESKRRIQAKLVGFFPCVQARGSGNYEDELGKVWCRVEDRGLSHRHWWDVIPRASEFEERIVEIEAAFE